MSDKTANDYVSYYGNGSAHVISRSQSGGATRDFCNYEEIPFRSAGKQVIRRG